jgi:hypothetical protein
MYKLMAENGSILLAIDNCADSDISIVLEYVESYH